jgi:hypothetical protein
MKPFPSAVQEAFPLSSLRLPDRPWWKQYRIGLVERGDGTYASTDEIERIDAENPIPHPGYRVGQIWCNDRGDCQMITQSNASRVASSEEFGHLADFGYVYLVADLACPHLAPWSPVSQHPDFNYTRDQLAQFGGI